MRGRTEGRSASSARGSARDSASSRGRAGTAGRTEAAGRAGASGRARTGADDRAVRRSSTGRDPSRAVDRPGWEDGPALETPRNWGGVARRGAGAATGRRVVGASRAWRDAVEAASPQRSPASARRAAPRDAAAVEAPHTRLEQGEIESIEIIVDDTEAETATGTGRSASRRTRRADPQPLDLAEEVREQLARAVPNARRERVERRLAEAAEHFEHERFADAARILKKLSDEAPTVAAVREIFGLTLYRQQKWKAAARELEAHRQLSQSADQLPVLADCYRALRQWSAVEECWTEIREVSPSAAVVTEGRIVMAGSLADRGSLVEAIRLLEQGWSFPKRPQIHHLRRAYALADLYERVGDVPRARQVFTRIRAVDADFADVRSRLAGLR
ncbi:MAG: hypothetical protein KGR18_01710 [Acidobacteria bacterium]|nr:hypothetical protein [Acidobacteriota bacterium]